MNLLDLFSGVGGFSLGLERAGMKTVAFCEIDAKATKVLNARWPGVPVFPDVRLLTKGELEKHGITQIDVICGGFPCQDISEAGKGVGIIGARSGLWSEYHRLIAEFRPRWAIIENVSALRNKGLALVLQNLSEIGYSCVFHCIPAAAVGATHQRDRVWIVAYPEGKGCQPGRAGCGGSQDGEVCHRQLADCGAALADPECAGRQGRLPGGPDTRGESLTRCIGRGLSGVSQRWVAGPGHDQFPWEPPRTIPVEPKAAKRTA